MDEVLDRIPLLSGLPRTVEELPGGLTNRNLKVSVPGATYVVRIPASECALLDIDRDAEHANALAAGRAGLGAPVHAYVRELGVLVAGFLPGRTLQAADLREPANLRRVAGVCRALHAGPRFARDFDMFEVRERYLRTVISRNFRLPAKYLDFEPQVARIRSALRVRAEGTVPCHNDLLAGNFIDDGERLRLIDFEYSGNNDPCFELGNIWSECDLTLEHLELLVTAYYGRRLRHRIARARLLGLMSKYGWTLWATIQDGTNHAIDFDFWSWGLGRFDSAAAEFTGPGLSLLLDEAARAD
ncbi:choline kinase family protein [Nonomuraea longicatena]|uniref:Choline kinase family protein n=1 Tax=Nonomuraea longicatena TaxID=83682 RepID=A0ABN1P940_9ACTN